MTMNLGTEQNYRSPSRMQLRDVRFQRGDLNKKFVDTLLEINQIEQATKSAHMDPMDHVSAIKEKSDAIFTPIPDQFKPHSPMKENPHVNAESRVKPTMQANQEWVSSIKTRPKKHTTTHEQMVSRKAPLKLTWDAQYAMSGKRPADAIREKTTSRLTGLFSQKALTNGEDVPMYKPPEGNRKAVVAKKLAEEHNKFIPIDKTRKAKVLAVKPRPTPAKVDKDFVPGCLNLDSAAGAERKAGIQAKLADEKKMMIAGKAFR